MSPPEAGEVFEFPYPFIHDTYTKYDNDGCAESPCWKPGARFENTCHGDTDTIADGIGKQSVTVIGTFKPGRYPARVFFVRKWTDPRGLVFGKGALRVTTINAFRSLVKGYRHQFELRESPLPTSTKLSGNCAMPCGDKLPSGLE